MLRYLLLAAAASFMAAGCSRQASKTSTGPNVVSAPMLSPEAITALKPIIPPQLGEPMAREPSIEETVADALARIGADAVPFLVETLEDPDPEVRMYAARALAMMGQAGQEAVPALIQHLRDPDERVRRASARALGQMGPAAKTAVKSLIQLLKEEAARNK